VFNPVPGSVPAQRAERNPRAKTLFQIVRALGMRLAELVAEIAEPRR